MKRILSIFFIFAMFIATGIEALADEANEALAFFNRYVEAANSYSPAITKMYSPSAKIIRQVIKPDGTLVDLNTDTNTYITQMKLGQATAKLRKYKNTYRKITVSKSGTGYKISSERQPTGETYWLKTYMIVNKQPDGNWLITEEMMQTKVQALLKYAK